MKVLTPGDMRKTIWQQELPCTGRGHGGYGCGALLLVDELDVFTTGGGVDISGVGEDVFLTIQCPLCGAFNNISPVFAATVRSLRREFPSFRDWMLRRSGKVQLTNVRTEGPYVLWDEVYGNVVDHRQAVNFCFLLDPNNGKQNLSELLLDYVKGEKSDE